MLRSSANTQELISAALSIGTACAALGCALVGGVFFAFSTFVMPALARLPAPTGIAAMQSINVTVINRWFMGAMFGTALLCLLLAVGSLVAWGQPGVWLRLGGCVLYLVGTILVTGIFNVPLNDTLAATPPDGAPAAGLWSQYLHAWGGWNHVRTVTSLAAAGCLTAAGLFGDR